MKSSLPVMPLDRHQYRLAALLLVLLLPTVTGCRLMVAAGKMLLGDPKMTSDFQQATGNDLRKSGDQLLIICTAPHSILVQHPSLQLDLLDRISRTLETRGVSVVSSDDVASWYDDHGEWGDYSQLAVHFGARYVAQLDLRRFTCQVPNSDLLQGNFQGRIQVFEVDPKKTSPVRQALDRELRMKFPETWPMPRGNQSDDIFIRTFVERVADDVSRIFYSYRFGETIY